MGSLPVVGKAHEAQQTPTGVDFNWFVYASSLDRAAFAEWVQEHGYALPDFARAVPACLSGFRLCFDVQSRFWGGAVASLAEDANASVEGLLLPMPGSARGLVDHKEGAISGLYVSFAVQVTPIAGGEPQNAIAYRAAPDRRLPSEGAPSKRFLEVLVNGAKASGLSESYVRSLEARLKSLGG
jgi:hypothetical protein